MVNIVELLAVSQIFPWGFGGEQNGTRKHDSKWVIMFRICWMCFSNNTIIQHKSQQKAMGHFIVSVALDYPEMIQFPAFHVTPCFLTCERQTAWPILWWPHLNLPSLSLRFIQGSSSRTSVKTPGDPLLEGGRLLLFPQLRPHPFPQDVTPSATQWPLPEPAGHTRGPPESPWRKMKGGMKASVSTLLNQMECRIRDKAADVADGTFLSLPGRRLFLLSLDRHTELSWLAEAYRVSG